MARPSSTIRRISKNISLPEDLIARMELALFSEAEGRIPVGAQSKLIEELLRRHFSMVTQESAQ